MNTKEKIIRIKDAIFKADETISKIVNTSAYEVPALASLKIRCLLNNLGELATNYLECGVHVSGSFSSTTFCNGNIKKAFAIDSWASDHMGGQVHEVDFRKYSAANIHSNTELTVIKEDCFNVDLSLIDAPIDMYLFDAGHSFEEQRDALIYYYPVLADEFIYCCDDWTYERVKEGTIAGIKECGFEILFEKELLNETPGGGHLNDEWWRGYYVALLKKKK